MQKRKIMFFHIGNATGADYKGFVFDNKRRKNINKQEKETSQLGFKFKNLFMSQVGNLLNLC
jgi:predicted N-acyltransferase